MTLARSQLLSNHGMALLCVAREPGSRLRDIATCVGITERAAHRIVSDLVEDGYLVRIREGNRNRYEIQPDVPMAHPLLEDHWVGELLAVLVTDRAALESWRSPTNGSTKPKQARPRNRRKTT